MYVKWLSLVLMLFTTSCLPPQSHNQLSIENPVSESYVNANNQSNIVVSGYCPYKGAIVVLSKGSGAGPCYNHRFSIRANFSQVPDQVLDFKVLSVNAQGQASSSPTVLLTKDTTVHPPSLDHPQTDALLSRANLILKGSCEVGSTVYITGDIQVLATSPCISHGTYSVKVNLTDYTGLKKISIYQVDLAANKSSHLNIEFNLKRLNEKAAVAAISNKK